MAKMRPSAKARGRGSGSRSLERNCDRQLPSRVVEGHVSETGAGFPVVAGCWLVLLEPVHRQKLLRIAG